MAEQPDHVRFSNNNRWGTRQLVTMALLTAVGAIFMFAQIPIIPGVTFLTYDPALVPATVAGFVYGPGPGVVVGVCAVAVHALITGDWVGALMNVVAGVSFILPAALGHGRARGFAGTVAGLACGVVLATAASIVSNLTIGVWFWYGSADAILPLLVPAVIPFNLAKALLNSVLTLVVFRAVSGIPALRAASAAGAGGLADGDADAAKAVADRSEGMGDAVVSCEDVRFSYDGGGCALDGVGLKVRPGELLCVLGGNGSGKSTLARHMDALLVPDEGRVFVRGLDTADAEYVYDIRSTVGLVFQNPDDQLVATLVADDVAFGPENLGVESPRLGERVNAALHDVGLDGFDEVEAHALSGGQKQRVAIAGALAMRPQVLVLDEASAMLDPRGRKGLVRLCRELASAGIAVVMVTHFMEEAAFGDRVVVLEGGKVALEGAPEDVLTRADVLGRLDLEMPPASRLGFALRERGVELVPHADEAAMLDEVAGLLSEEGDRGGCPALAGAGSFSAASGPCGLDEGSPAKGTLPYGDPCIEFEHVFYSYEPSRRKRALKGGGRASRREGWGGTADAAWALEDVSFEVRRGELLGIAGHTGSGKSTIVQHMNGLVRPTRGTVRAFGRDLADKHAAAEARRRVGVVLQYPEHQLFAQTVFEDVAFGPRNLGLAEEEVDGRVREALELVGLSFDEVADRSPFALSGGQQRRCAFAGVLAMRPEVLVLDEPTAGLDPAAHREFLQLVSDLHAGGLTVVMVSHNMDDLAALCDRVLVMNAGAVYVQGTPEQVFSDGEALERVGLGLPAAVRMARGLAARGVALAGGLYSIESLAEEVALIVGGFEEGRGLA